MKADFSPDLVAAKDSAGRCRLCAIRLGGHPDDAAETQLCVDCKGRPEARRLDERPPASGAARAFTPAEKALIKKLQGLMPSEALLALLNERLQADLGPDAHAYTLGQLHEEFSAGVAATITGTNDWAGLRKVLGQARRSGLLGRITLQMVTDFSIVYSLSQAQSLRLKDTIASASE